MAVPTFGAMLLPEDHQRHAAPLQLLVCTFTARSPMLSPSLAAHADQVPRSGYRGSDFVLWRGVDFFFLPGLSSPETFKHVGRMHIPAYRAWHAFHLTGKDPSVWEDYTANADVQESFRYIRHHQTRLIEDAYGTSQDSLFDSLWKFGGNLLPPDPQIAIPSERTMNSPYDWFFWAPYIEMSLRDSDATDADLRLARAWQVGVAADGLLRNRLEIADFDANAPDVDQKVKNAFDAAQKDDLIAGMISRAKAFPNSPFFRGWPGIP